MSHNATLRLAFDSPETAAHVAAALEPENAGHATTRVEGAVLVIEAQAASPMSLLHTLDDVLACAGAAEKAAALARGP